jgi:hypothetical protein
MRQFADMQETWKQSIEQWTEFVNGVSNPDSWAPKPLREMFALARWSGQDTGASDADLQQVIEGIDTPLSCRCRVVSCRVVSKIWHLYLCQINQAFMDRLSHLCVARMRRLSCAVRFARYSVIDIVRKTASGLFSTPF